MRRAIPQTQRVGRRVTALEQRQSEPWIEVAGGVGFAGTWVNYGGGWETAGYYKDPLGEVHVKGLVKNGAALLIFTLPAGYRPSAGIHFATVASAGANEYGVFQIDSGGNVTLASAAFGNAWVSLRCQFRAA